MNTKVCIICPEHGEFWQSPYLHTNGSGCPKCAKMLNGASKRLTKCDFLAKAKEIHGDKYDYSNVEYITAKNKVKIICPSHGEFLQTPDKHLSGCGCPKCVHSVSKAEKEIYEFITTLIGFENIIQGDRSVLNGKEIDIFIPKCKISIEYNGLYWHTLETHSDKNYHLNKTNLCNDKGIKLIQIFEDEYVNHKDLVLSKIAHILGKCENLPKIMARKCEIKEISATKSKSFLNKNHIQGNGDGRIHLGAFYNGLLIGVMVFKNECGDKWELTRFATDNSYVCSGVGGKLFKYFTRTYNPTEVKSFADRRWTINEESNVYTNLGFEFNGYTPPDYKYYSPFDGLIRHHKFNFRKTILHKKYNLPLSMTESEMTKSLGYSKIYDCGLIKYIWKKRG